MNRANAEKMLKQQMQQQQEAAANQQRVMTEEELKNMQAQGAEKRADYKVQAQVSRADEANRTRAEVVQKKADMDAANKCYEIALNHQVKQQEAQSKISIDRFKAAATQPPTVENPSQDLVDLQGETPAVNDIESVPTV